MKKLLFTLLSCLIATLSFAQNYFYVEKTDGTIVPYDIEEVTRISFEKPTPIAIELSDATLQVKVGETSIITAIVTPLGNYDIEWTSLDESIATIVDGQVTGIAEGTTTIIAKVDDLEATCVVTVYEGNLPNLIDCSQIWPIILDGETYAVNESKVVASFQPNDVDQFLYTWDDTYNAGSTTGLNFYGNSGGCTSLVVGGKGWSGAGYCLTEAGNGWEAAKALKDAIVENPDDYYLHLAIKSTDNYSHCFYIMGSEDTKFVLGSKSVYDGPVMKDFTRDGSWQEFDIPMSTYAAALASADVKAGVNVFVILSEGVQGAELNLDAVYFYKK